MRLLRNTLFITLLSTVVLSISSCGADHSKKKIILDGQWNIYLAERNDKVTKTLEGGFFKFYGDTSFSSNLFGTENLFKFEQKGGRFVTTDGDPPLDFNLISHGTDSIVLSGKMKSFKMSIYLVKDSIRQ